FGALHLGCYEDGRLVYAGRAGSGFTERQLAEVGARLEAAPRSAPPPGNAPKGKEHVWVEPAIVCEVSFTEWTEEGLLRQPVFLRFREDRTVEDCLRKTGAPRPAEPASPVEPAERVVPFSNLDKVFWPEEGYTKGDLIEYHRRVAEWLLPYLRDRPLVLTRYPDGIGGKSFYQKDAPGFVPGWVRTERMWSEHAGREIDYFVCDDLDSLLYVVNLGTIPIHVWSSRAASIQRPDWCVVDLDPKEAPFEHVVRIALEIRSVASEIGLECFIKTSGATGLHVLFPLGGQCTYDQSRTLGELVSRVIVGRLPEISTITRTIRARGGRVYLDYLQNRHGQTIVAPFSVRPLPGAPVSTPLSWSEVGPRLDPRRFTIRTVPARMLRRPDPLLPVLDRAPDLLGALARLAGILGG
ncbi:MAG: non-homologous end-joining DNA ligase, partial [Candidatus Binatia bacterium]